LTPIQFKTYEEKSTLASAIQFLNQLKNPSSNKDVPTDESAESDVYDDSFSISSLNDADDLNNLTSDKNSLEFNKANEAATYVPRRAFNEDGKPLGMFPENQAKTMCVDVVSVYSPPIADSNFNELINRSPSVVSSNAEETSSISSSSSSYSATNEHNPPADPNDTYNEFDDNTFEDETPSNNLTKGVKLVKNDSVTSSNTTPVNKKFNNNNLPDNIQNSKQHTNSSGNQTPKKSSISRITQLGDVLINDVASKARHLSSNLTSKKLSNILNDDSFKEKEVTAMIKNSLSSLSIKTDSNNNINKFVYESNQTLPSMPIDPNLASMAANVGSNSPFVLDKSNLNSSQSDLNSENQQFLKEILAGVLEGQGVGWLKYNRVKRLMEDENYRNFVLSRLNTSLDKKLSSDEEHIEDVKVNKAVFKGMSKLLTLIIYGLEQTYANNGLGGMASAFQLLEIAHTHYWMPDNEATNQSGKSTDGAMSPMSENSNSPYGSKENLNNVVSANSTGVVSGMVTSSSSSVYGLNLMSSQPDGNTGQSFNIQTTGNIVAQLGNYKF